MWASESAHEPSSWARCRGQWGDVRVHVAGSILSRWPTTTRLIRLSRGRVPRLKPVPAESPPPPLVGHVCRPCLHLFRLFLRDSWHGPGSQQVPPSSGHDANKTPRRVRAWITKLFLLQVLLAARLRVSHQRSWTGCRAVTDGSVRGPRRRALHAACRPQNSSTRSMMLVAQGVTKVVHWFAKCLSSTKVQMIHSMFKVVGLHHGVACSVFATCIRVTDTSF